jgi:hypothetical protein
LTAKVNETLAAISQLIPSKKETSNEVDVRRPDSKSALAAVRRALQEYAEKIGAPLGKISIVFGDTPENHLEVLIRENPVAAETDGSGVERITTGVTPAMESVQRGEEGPEDKAE